MRWRGGRRSDNVEDRRGERASGGFSFPFPRSGRQVRFPFPQSGGGSTMRKGGVGGVGLIILVVLFFVFGGDLGDLMQQTQMGPGGLPPTEPMQGSRPQANDELSDFVSVVLADTEDTWRDLFQNLGKTYSEPKLVLFSTAVDSACGFAQSATGPFYCPRDRKVYIDLSFYNDLKNRFSAPGDFAQAYVIAHEIGHHVQTLLGISDKVREAQARMSQTEANGIQVRMELQADCLAGIWANRADRSRSILEAGDIEEALQAASAIGDDRLQRQAQGYVVPDAFTHGTSKQRARWFTQGFKTGQLGQCDTFSADPL